MRNYPLFEVMTDGAFADWQSRGVESREDIVISETERDADPFSCTGDEFDHDATGPPSGAHWFELD